MSVVDGQDVKAATFNNEFLSKTEDSETIGKLSTSNVTDSTSPSTGALHSKGGLGVEKSAHVGGDVVASGNVTGINVSGSNTGDATFNNVGTTSSPKGVTQVGQVFTLQPADDLNPGLMSILAQMFSGVKTFKDKVYFLAGIEVQGTTTLINTTELQVQDAYVTINKGGNDTSAAGAGFEVDGITGGNAAIQYDSTLASKWKIGKIGALYEVIVAAGTQVIGGLKTFSSLLTTSDLLVDGKRLATVQTNSQTGTGITLTNPTKPVVILTGVSLVSISKITNPSSNSQSVILINRTGSTVTVKNNDAAVDDIVTGTGADLDVANGKVIELVYDTQISGRWRIVGGTGSGGGSFTNIVTKTASVTILATEDCVLIDASAGNMTLTLPSWALKERHIFKRIDSVEANTVTITAAGSDKIDGASNYTLPYQFNTLRVDGITSGNWGIF